MSHDNGLTSSPIATWTPRPGRRLARVAAALVAFAICVPISAAQAQPTDTTVFTDDFESGTLANWTVATSGNGTAQVQPSIGTNGSKAARLTVPNYSTNSLAFIRRTLTPAYGLSASGSFKVLSGGCSADAGYSAGNVPFLRLFDADGRRVAGLYRINGSCSKTAKLYVQHSGGFYRTGKNISFGTVSKAELRISVSEPSKSLVQVYLDGSKVYESTIADNGLQPIASVTVHNEHPDQVGDLIADDIKVATFPVTPPSNPCDATAPLPVSTDPGTTILADNYELFTFNQWTTVTREGSATASIQTANVHGGRCAALLDVPADAASKANLSKSTPAGTGAVWANGWFNVLSEGTNTNSNVPFFRVFSGATRIVDVYRVNATGQVYLRLTPVGGAATYQSLGRNIALNTWHELKVHANVSAASDTVAVTLDGQSLSIPQQPSLATNVVNSVMIGSEHFAQEGKLVADDTVINAAP